jgi:hypothetical protein
MALNTVMLSVVTRPNMLSVIMLSVVMLNFVMLSVVMLNFVMLRIRRSTQEGLVVT